MKNTLIVDIGNSYVKIGIFNQGNQLVKKHLFKSEQKCTLKELKEIFNENFGEIKIQHAIVGSVVPYWNDNFITIIRKLYKVEPYLINNRTLVSFEVEDKIKKEMGDDILALCEYCHRKNKNAIGFSFGTAMFGVYLNERKLVGVSIAPGLSKSFDELIKNASLLKIKNFNKKSKISYGVNTVSAIEAGYNAMRSGFVLSFYKNVKNKKDLSVILTGGEVADIDVNFDYLIDENAILLGLKYIYELNN